MKKIYSFAAEPVERTVTIADMRAAKGHRKLIQVTANTALEALAVQEAGIDMMVCDAANVQTVRSTNKTTFVTAAIKYTEHATTDEIMREAFRCLHHGADAIITPRSFHTVERLAREDIPVMGHLGLVPRKSIWSAGMRAVGKTASEAAELLADFKRLEDAGAFAVEAEVIAGDALSEIAPRVGLICVSLGSGSGGDVMFLFMNDLCGETPNPPRHAQAFGNLAALHEALHDARVDALMAFKGAVNAGDFPTREATPKMRADEIARFQAAITNH